MKLTYNILRILFISQLCILNKGGYANKPVPDSLNSCEGYFEQVTLFTDRTLYIAGEEIWFSAFLQCNNKPACHCLSEVIYIDIYRGLNSNSIKQKLKIEHGNAGGSIHIPDNFPTGNYYIRAYTNYQKNYPIESLTLKEIVILNPEIPLSSSDGDNNTALFFRGGSAIYGLPVQGAFISPNQQNNITSATIVSEKNEVISAIRLVNPGLGVFEFTPQYNKDYFVRIYFNNNDSSVYPIQNISNSGWNITSRWDDEYLHINLAGANTKAIHNGILVIKDQYLRTVLTESFHAEENKWQTNIPENQLETKTNYILVKNGNNEIIQFTVASKPANKIIPLLLETNKSVYSPHEPVELTISELNREFESYTNLIASVSLKGTLQNPEITNSDFDAFAGNAIIYENSIRQNNASLKKILSEKTELSVNKLPDIREVSLTGVVINSISEKPVPHCKVYLSVLGDEPQLHICETNKEGSFIFSLNTFTGIRKLVTGVDYSELKNTTILINNDFIQEYIPPYNTLSFSKSDHQVYEELYINKQVAENFGIRTKRNLSTDFIPQRLYTHPYFSIVLADYIELSSVQEVFTEIVPYTYLRQKRDTFYFQMQDRNTDAIISNPLVLLDNIPVFDINAILELSPATIERINIINQEYFLGAYKLNGVINIISKEPQLEHIEFPSGTVFFDYQTLTPASRFILPETIEKWDRDESVPCFSNLLYWNSRLVSDKFPLNLKFYTADNESEYKIVVRGITPEGIPCFGEKIIRVRSD